MQEKSLGIEGVLGILQEPSPGERRGRSGPQEKSWKLQQVGASCKAEQAKKPRQQSPLAAHPEWKVDVWKRCGLREHPSQPPCLTGEETATRGSDSVKCWVWASHDASTS